MDMHKNTVCSLLFFTPKSANVFNLFGLFSREETDSGFEAWIDAYAPVLKIDTTDYWLKQVKEYYGIRQTPWIVVINQNKVVMNELALESVE